MAAALIVKGIANFATVAALLRVYVLPAGDRGSTLLPKHVQRAAGYEHPYQEDADPCVRNQKKQHAAHGDWQSAPPKDIPWRKRQACQSASCWEARIHGNILPYRLFVS